ncbi:MAG: glycine--tRNA ligase, partial [Planctomycetes bacterium]|nr:glycine--tRNA ligase [Planctomycetota bacterium]
WHRALGLDPERLQFHPHGPGELAHYARAAVDIQYRFPFGWQEVEGIHNRGDYDLGRHQQFSGKDLTYFDDGEKKRYLPNIVETSIGPDRLLLACLVDAYHEEEVEGETRTVLRLSPAVAPYQAAVFPLVNRDGMPERARLVAQDLRARWRVYYDEKGAIGRRYRRQDEAGTPYCLTVDGQTAQDGTVTLRDRDTMKQERVSTAELPEAIAARLKTACPILSF